MIKPPLLENSIEIQIKRHFFAHKSNFWGFFEQKLEKFHSYFNKPPHQTLDFFISHQRLIDADMACVTSDKLQHPMPPDDINMGAKRALSWGARLRDLFSKIYLVK